MTITKNQNGSALTVCVEGRLDTVTAPDLEKEIAAVADSVNESVMDIFDVTGFKDILTIKQLCPLAIQKNGRSEVHIDRFSFLN